MEVRKTEVLSKIILNYIKKVDEFIEIKDKHIDYKSKRPRIMFNLYDNYPLSFIELPIVRSVRTKLDIALSSSIVSIKKLQTGKRDSVIYSKYPGTLITYGKVDSIKNPKLPFVLKYFLYLYPKPLLYINDIKTNNQWHLNCILPNITSFLTISNEFGKVEYLMPFSGVVFLDYSNKKVSKR